MRVSALAVVGTASLLVTVVACETGPAPGEKVIRSAQPIQGGTVDQGDSNVVAILINDGTGSVGALCSGSLIGPNLVLSAHHCVATPPNKLVCGAGFTNPSPASYFEVTTSYNAAYNIWVGSGKMPTADGVTWFGVSSIAVPGNDICGDDLSALTLSSSVSGVCPLVPNVDTQIAANDTYTAIGFGITSPGANTAGERYKVTGMGVECVGATACKDTTISTTDEWEGGSSSQQGTCEGDSGGPALDSLNRVIGSVSRGPSNACNETVYESYYGQAAWIKQMAQAAATAGGYTAAGWVTGGATSNPANGYPCGGTSTDGGTGMPDGGTGTTDAGTGTTDAGGPLTTCSGVDGFVGCCEGNVVYYCNMGVNTVSTTTCDSGSVCGWDPTGNFYNCVAPPAEASPNPADPLECSSIAVPDAGSPEDAGASGHDAGAPPTDSGAGGDDSGSATGEEAGAVDSGVASSSDAAAGGDATAANPDGGAPEAEDGGSVDGGKGLAGNSGGCGCTTVRSDEGATPWLAWMGVGAVALIARSRRRAWSARRA